MTIIILLLALILFAILFPSGLRALVSGLILALFGGLIALLVVIVVMGVAHATEAREPTQITTQEAEQWCLRDVDGYIDDNKVILQKAAACARRVLAMQKKIQDERVPCGNMCKPSVGRESCMPDAPNGRAPQWAVDIAKRQGDIATSPTDPVWQHATCDKVHHTINWQLPD